MAIISPEAKERKRERNRKWRLENPDKVRAIRRKSENKFTIKMNTSNDIESYLKYIRRNSKKSAKQRNIVFELTYEDLMAQLLIQEGKCAYTGIDLVYSTKSDFTISIDRIDSDGDYTKDNFQFTLGKINVMKTTFTHDQFISICKLIASRF